MNAKNNRAAGQLATILAAGAALGLLALFCKTAFGWDPLTVIVAGGVLLLAVLLARVFWLRGRMNANAALLDEGRVDEFVAATEALLRKTKMTSWRQSIALNLSAGYCKQGRYADAVALLDGIPLRRMAAPLKTIYYNNYASALFRAGRAQEAVRFLAGHEQELEVSPEDIPYLAHLQGTRAWLLAAKGQFGEARALTAELRQTGDADVQEDLDALEAWMDTQGKADQA